MTFAVQAPEVALEEEAQREWEVSEWLVNMRHNSNLGELRTILFEGFNCRHDTRELGRWEVLVEVYVVRGLVPCCSRKCFLEFCKPSRSELFRSCFKAIVYLASTVVFDPCIQAVLANLIK